MIGDRADAADAADTGWTLMEVIMGSAGVFIFLFGLLLQFV